MVDLHKQLHPETRLKAREHEYNIALLSCFYIQVNLPTVIICAYIFFTFRRRRKHESAHN